MSPDEWLAVVHPEDRESTVATMMKTTTENCSNEARIYKAGADRSSLDPANFFWVSFQGGPSFDEDGTYMFSSGTTVDVTMQKTHEFNLMKLASDAQELQRKQNGFIDMISHEVREHPFSKTLIIADKLE